jgi:hypothetical protein
MAPRGRWVNETQKKSQRCRQPFFAVKPRRLNSRLPFT